MVIKVVGTFFYATNGQKPHGELTDSISNLEKYERVDIERLAPDLDGHPQTNQLKHFLDSIQNGTRPESDGREIIKTIELVTSMYTSRREGLPVRNGGKVNVGS
jgi:predicted dehydrogenase